MRKLLLRRGKVVAEELPSLGEPGDHEIRVQVMASALSPGTESAMVVSGVFDLSRNLSLAKKAIRFAKERGIGAVIKKLQERFNQAIPMGYSASGVVVSCGARVLGFAPGDEVACAGGQFANHAEEILASSRLTVQVPKGVSFEEASAVTLGAIALEGLRKLDAKIGESVVIMGLGALGQLAAQMASAAGNRVTGIDRDQARVRFALDHGFVEEAYSTDGDLVERIKERTQGHGADGVLIFAHAPGDSSVLELAAKLVRRRGRVTIVGDIGVALPRSLLYEKDISLNIAVSYGPGRYDPNYEERAQDYPLSFVRWTAQRNMACFLDLVQRKKVLIKPLIQASFSIDQAERAYENLSRANPRPLLTVLAYPSTQLRTGPKEKREEKKASVVIGKKQFPCKLPIKVGVIGAGSFVTSVHLPLIAGMRDRYLIKTICNKRPERAQAVAKSYHAALESDYREVFNDPDIDLVLIGTRHNLHASLAAEALRSGKAVFLEKPMATTLADLETLEACFADNPAPFHVGFNRRFSSLLAEAKKCLDLLPKPWILNYRVATQVLPQGHWALDPIEGAGRVIGEACHMVDLIGFLLKPQGLAAPFVPLDVKVGSLALDCSSPNENFSSVLTYPGGSLATLVYTSSRTQELGKERLEIITPAGVIILEDFKELIVKIENQKLRKIVRSASDKGFENGWRVLADFLSGRAAQPPLSFEEAAETTRLTFLMDDLARRLEPNS